MIESKEEMDTLPGNLKFPLFVKPAKAGDSLGIDEQSKVNNMEDLNKKC